MKKNTEDRQLFLDLGQATEKQPLISSCNQQVPVKNPEGHCNVISITETMDNRQRDKESNTFGLILERIRHLIDPS